MPDTTRQLTDRLRAAEAAGQGLIDSLSSHVAILDEHGRIIAVNAAWCRFAAAEDGDADCVGSDYIAVCRVANDPLATAVARGLSEILAGSRKELLIDYPCHSPSQQRWFQLRATRYVGVGPLRVIMLHADVTERHQAQEQAFLHSALLDEVDVSVILTDLDRTVLSWNAGAERLYGWRAADAIGRPVSETILPPELFSLAAGEAVLELHPAGRPEGDYVARRHDGSTFPAHVCSRLISDLHGQVTGAANVAVDISERRALERASVSAQNYLQAVTDNMGEGLFTLDADGCARYMNQVALDLLGWPWQEIQGRELNPILQPLRPDGSRRPIDESPLSRAGQDGRLVRVESDIFVRHDGSHLPVAYTASPFATADGIEGCVVLFEDITERQAAAARIERDQEKCGWRDRILDALTEERFVLHAQPIIDLHSGAIVQHELLIRMRDACASGAVRGLIAPDAFLPVAEESGLITEIDRWVIDRATEIAAAGRAVEVNLSGRSLSARGLVGHVENALQRAGADPGNIVFEITETALVSGEPPAAQALVESLHALGCQVALDDFGTGYGGFTYLKQLPVDFLKIDIEFVLDALTNPASRSVIRSIVSLADSFGARTVGEGVEDQATLNLLRELGVDYAQGFHIGRPTPLELSRKCVAQAGRS